MDYYLKDVYPLHPDYSSYGSNNEVSALDEDAMKDYLPEYQRLFPQLTLKEMEAVQKYKFEWYDGSSAPYLYSDEGEGETI